MGGNGTGSPAMVTEKSSPPYAERRTQVSEMFSRRLVTPAATSNPGHPRAVTRPGVLQVDQVDEFGPQHVHAFNDSEGRASPSCAKVQVPLRASRTSDRRGMRRLGAPGRAPATGVVPSRSSAGSRPRHQALVSPGQVCPDRSRHPRPPLRAAGPSLRDRVRGWIFPSHLDRRCLPAEAFGAAPALHRAPPALFGLRTTEHQDPHPDRNPSECSSWTDHGPG